MSRFRYLGFNLSSTERSHFLDSQIGAAWSAFNKSRNGLVNRRINLPARIVLLESLVRSRLLYSVQAWSLNFEEMRRIEVVYRGFLRKMVRGGYRKVGVNEDGKNAQAFVISNERLYDITKTAALSSFIN